MLLFFIDFSFSSYLNLKHFLKYVLSFLLCTHILIWLKKIPISLVEKVIAKATKHFGFYFTIIRKKEYVEEFS